MKAVATRSMDLDTKLQTDQRRDYHITDGKTYGMHLLKLDYASLRLIS